MRTGPAFALFLWMNVVAAFAGEGEIFPPPQPNQPWEHAETGLRLPSDLAKMRAEQGFRYESAALGCSMRYSDPKTRIRGDVYVYPSPKKASTAEEIKEALRESAGSAVGEVEEMQKRGRYKNLKRGQAEYEPFDLIPQTAGVSALLSLPMEYSIVEDGVAGDAETKVGSFLGIMMLKNYLVKVRITYPLGGEDREQEKVEQRISDFVNEARRCVLDPGLREEAAAQIKTYRHDPLSEAGHDAAGGILAYAEVTPMITLTIDDTVSTLGKDLEKACPGATLEFVRAFIVGAVAESLKQPGKEPADLPQAGAAEILRVFDAMKKAHPKLSSPRLKELETAVKAQKASAWLSEQAAKNEK